MTFWDGLQNDHGKKDSARKKNEITYLDFLKFSRLKKANLCVGAVVDTSDSDKIGFQHTVCHQTRCHVEQLESSSGAGQVALPLRQKDS